MTLASAKLSLDKVPEIVDDEGTWFVDLLPLKGNLCTCDSRIGVQVRKKEATHYFIETLHAVSFKRR